MPDTPTTEDSTSVALAVPFPSRTIVPPDLDGTVSDRFVRELELAAELANRSIATTTREKYSDAWRWFCEYCERRGVTPLPAHPSVVVAWISSMVHGDETRGNGAALSAASIQQRLAAVNKAHTIAGFQPPGKHPEVELVMRGAIRTVGLRPTNRKRPLLIEELQELCQLMDTIQTGSDTDVVVASLLGNKKISAVGAGAVARIRVDDVTISGTTVEVTLRPHGKTPVHVRLDGLESRVVDAWRSVCERHASWPLFESRAGVIRTARRICGLPASPLQWPDVTPRAAAAAVRRLFDTPAAVVRDKAMILCGFATAGRRSNLCRLTWDDCTLVPGRGVRILFRRTKTDQVGEGTVLWLPYGNTETACPVKAFERWRQRAREEAAERGVELTGSHPVFVGVDRHGNCNWARALSAEGFVQRLKMWAAAIGLPADEIGGHTLRSGFVTSAVLANLRIDEIQKVSGHRSVAMVMRYVREVEQWRHNPAANIGL